MFGFIDDLVRVAVAPVRVVASVTRPVSDAVREVTKPLAEAAEDIVKNLRDE